MPSRLRSRSGSAWARQPPAAQRFSNTSSPCPFRRRSSLAMLTVDDALAKIVQTVERFPPTTVPLGEALTTYAGS